MTKVMTWLSHVPGMANLAFSYYIFQKLLELNDRILVLETMLRIHGIK